MARRLRPVELDFTASAPVRLVHTATLEAPPSAVYRSLAVEVGSMPSWFTAVVSAVPTGDGAGRTIRLRGGIVFEETILAAEPDVRYGYRVDLTNAPGVTAMVHRRRVPFPAGERAHSSARAVMPGAFVESTR